MLKNIAVFKPESSCKSEVKEPLQKLYFSAYKYFSDFWHSLLLIGFLVLVLYSNIFI